MTSIKAQFRTVNPYEIHKRLINEYILNRPGATKLLNRKSIQCKHDIDVIRENHKFLWDNETPGTWEEQLAKKYYDKLFKEYTICDLTRYKENMVALRWRIEKEVVAGKGQFSCGNKKCDDNDNLRSWEVNFAYVEQGEKKNALVKLRLCTKCSSKLNYHSRKREIKRLKSRKTKNVTFIPSTEEKEQSNLISDDNIETIETETTTEQVTDDSLWQNKRQTEEEKSRDEEFEEYLEELLL